MKEASTSEIAWEEDDNDERRKRESKRKQPEAIV